MRPTERLVHDRWQPHWLRYEHLERYRFVADQVHGRVVVDCARGDGTGTSILVEAGAARVHGFDIDPEAVAQPWNPFHLRECSIGELHELLPTRFADITFSGQNDRNAIRAALLRSVGRVLPWNLAVRPRQIAKLPMIVYDTPGRHQVRALDHRRPPEIVVAVCREPQR